MIADKSFGRHFRRSRDDRGGPTCDPCRNRWGWHADDRQVRTEDFFPRDSLVRVNVMRQHLVPRTAAEETHHSGTDITVTDDRDLHCYADAKMWLEG